MMIPVIFRLTLVSACIRVGIYCTSSSQPLLPTSVSPSSSVTSTSTTSSLTSTSRSSTSSTTTSSISTPKLSSSTTTRPNLKLYERNQKLAKLYYEECLLHYDEIKNDNINDNENNDKKYNYNSLPYIRAAVRLDPYNIDYLSLLIYIEESLDIINKISQRKQKLSLLLSYNYTNFDDVYINKRRDSSSRRRRRGDDIITKSVLNVTLSYIKKIIRTNRHCHMKLCRNSDDDSDNDGDSDDSNGNDQLRYDLLSRPFVIHTQLHKENVTSSSSTTTPLSLLQRLNETYFNTLIEFYPHNLLQSSSIRYNISLHTALQFLLSPEGAYFSVDISDPGTYIQWNLNRTVYDDIINNNYYVNLNHSIVGDEHFRIINNNDDDDDDDGNDDDRCHDDRSCYDSNVLSILNNLFPPTSKLFSSSPSSSSSSLKTNHQRTIITTEEDFEDFYEKTHWRMLLIGEQYSGMFFHQDALPVGSWQLQLQGSKRWTICEPTFNLSSDYHHDGISEFNDDFGNISSSSSSSSPVPESSSSPSLCYEVTIHEGDIIYYPPSYWHQTINIDDTVSIAISNTVIIDENKLIQFIRNECDIIIPPNDKNDHDCNRRDVDDDYERNNDNVFDKYHPCDIKNENNKMGIKYGYQFSQSFCNLFRP